MTRSTLDGGTDPRPAWLVLDAARNHRFTGEVVFRTHPVARVSFDRGEIYFAERTSDPSLAQRLVDAGVLTPGQVDRGSVRIGGVRHLGRLFDRVPGLDPHALLVAVDLLTDECVSWLAPRPVSEVAWLPYRRHSSGVHQWRQHDGGSLASHVDPMLSPLAAFRGVPEASDRSADPTATSVAVPDARSSDARSSDAESFEAVTGEVRIEWEQPSWLDRIPGGSGDATRAGSVVRSAESAQSSGSSGSADVEPDPDPVDEWSAAVLVSAAPSDERPSARRRRPDTDATDRFELVWPSGEVDDQLGSIDHVDSVEAMGPVDGVDRTVTGDGVDEAPTEQDEPVRIATTIRRRTTADDPADGAVDAPDDGRTASSGAPSEAAPSDPAAHTELDAHPAARRRMLPRRR